MILIMLPLILTFADGIVYPSRDGSNWQSKRCPLRPTGRWSYERDLSTTSRVESPNLNHPLIWSVDWNRVSLGEYAVVDPCDSTSILYLSKKEYLKVLGLSLSNDSTLVVLATPGTSKPEEKSIKAQKPENSPPSIRLGHGIFWRGLRSRLNRSYHVMLSPSRDVFSASQLHKHLGSLLKRWSLTLGHWLSFPKTILGWMNDVSYASVHLQRVLKEQGTNGLSLRLKHSYLLISQYLADTPKLSSTYGHPVRLAKGLPKWLPVNARYGIRKRSLRVIRFWLSFCYLYKMIEVPYRLGKALRAITSPASSQVDWQSDTVKQLLSDYRRFLRHSFVPYIGGPRGLPKDEPGCFFTPIASGPNGSPAIERVDADAQALLNDKEQGGKILENVLAVATFLGVPLTEFDIEMAAVRFESKDPPRHSKVHILAEPAGKLRPVALLDIFTQRVLKPLHKDLFSLMKKFKTDGTFSQNDLLKYLQTRMQTDLQGYFWSSIDISSATDNISRRLYSILLEEIYGKSIHASGFIDFVLKLMVDRDFHVQLDQKLKKGKISKDQETLPKVVRYAEGQPMGCLSSFALLGLWNHSWVAFAAFQEKGIIGFSDYGITGDDVVIAEPERTAPIGRRYTENCSVVGVPISLAKSFLSCKLFNFLSRTILDTGEVSPTSIREDIAIRDSASRVQRALKTHQRGWWESTGDGWLSKAVKQFLYPTEYLMFQQSLKKGTLSGYGLRAVLAFLSPSSAIASTCGLSRVPVFGWLSAFAGSTLSLARGNLLRDNKLQSKDSTEVKQQFLRELLDLLIKEIIDVHKWNWLQWESYPKFELCQSWPLRYPGVRRLFLPTDREFDSKYVVFREWNIQDLEAMEYSMELTRMLGGDFLATENLESSVQRALSWLSRLNREYEFSNPRLFVTQANSNRRNKYHGEDAMTMSERRIMTLMYRISTLYPEAISLDLSLDQVNRLEKKFVDAYLGTRGV